MITRDLDAFLACARDARPDFGPATARAAFLVAPDGFALAEQSAQDNVYMAGAAAFDAQRASMQHRGLQRAMSRCADDLLRWRPAPPMRCPQQRVGTPRPRHRRPHRHPYGSASRNAGTSRFFRDVWAMRKRISRPKRIPALTGAL